MNSPTIAPNLQVSDIAENLIGSEIIKLAGEINEKIKAGEKIYNLTIGDFNPKIYPIPQALKDGIAKAYQNDETNYPPADGILALRNGVSNFLKHYGNLDYNNDEILIAGGARPLIYATYLTILNPNEKVLFPVPSWNNNHYSHLLQSQQLIVETTAENNFMPTAAALKPYISEASLVALCSPLNPTGTTFNAETLGEICDLILEENTRRGPDKKPVYLMYDQIYWMLTYGNTQHVNPVALRPEMRNYTIFIDGLSKAFAATGVRVGWSFGPKKIIDKMKSVLGHIGAWAPKAEQVAVAEFMGNQTAMDTYLNDFKAKINLSLHKLYDGIMKLKEEGFPVQAIAPQAAIYLTAQFNLKGYYLPNGELINDTPAITSYLLNGAGFAAVPFSAFGGDNKSTWYRLSIGNCKLEDIPQIIIALRQSLSLLSVKQ